MQIEVLGERYQLQDPIGRGGMATIYRGRDMHMDRVVAIKVLREVYSTDPKFVTRFQREAKAASSLQHPNIVQVFDYGQSDGNYFIAMELIEGTDLRRYLRSRGVLAVDRAIIIAHDVALGLGAAHRRSIVHRDVKPQNVLVGRDGSIKLTDFGIASVYKDINAERLTTTGMTLGTVQYYAPEQAQGEIVSPAADVYALGIVMYEMLTGRTPFEGDTPVAVAMQHIQDAPIPPSQINPNIPPSLEKIILRCLEKVPTMRYRDGSVLARSLEQLGEGEFPGMMQQVPFPPTNATFPPSLQSGGSSSGSDHHLDGRPASPLASSGVPHNYGQNSIRLGPENAAATALRSEQPLDPSSAVTTSMEPQTFSADTLDTNNEKTRPFNRDDIGGGVQSFAPSEPANRPPRTAGFVTLIILLATLILLGVSFYLAGQLGFLPFMKSSTNNIPATTTVQQVTVPDLIGLTYSKAETLAETKGLHIRLSTGTSSSGVVKQQTPAANSHVSQGSVVVVVMATQTKKVPADLLNQTLSAATAELNSDGIRFTQMVNPSDVEDATLGPNIVTGCSPNVGQTIADGQTIILYITNFTGSTSTPPANTQTSPNVSQTQQAVTPEPTSKPTPTKTTVVATPVPTQPVVVPTPTPVIVTPTPTIGITTGVTS